MKLAQFTTKKSARRRLGVLLGNVVCDAGELARASQAAGASVADWLLEIDSSLAVIERGQEGLQQLKSLVNSQPVTQRSAVDCV
jgi:hypothetical protein